MSIKTLRDLLDSPEYDTHRFGANSDDWLRDEERMKRCHDAADYDCDGSTHGEHIQDWRDCLADCFSGLDEDTIDSISVEIDACETWHVENGTLNQEGG